jgi:hypothetical protein
MMSTVLTLLFASFLCALSFAYPQPPRRMSTLFNAWEMEGLSFQRWNRSTSPNMGAIFMLYRSYYKKCMGPLSPWILLLTGEPCDTWVIPDTPIFCRGGIKAVANDPPLDSNPNSSWFTCDRYHRAVEGEEEVPEERKQWLKWRIFDLQERDPAKTQIPKPEEPWRKQIPFKSAKLEIVNGIPIKYVETSKAV